MNKKTNKKNQQLGIPFGTAQNRLRKLIMFDLLNKLNKLVCFHCGKSIDTVRELSIEHKIPWQDNDVALFWDMENITFSHLSCNCAAGKKPRKKLKTEWTHGIPSTYKRGCRCDLCRTNHNYRHQLRRKRKRL